MIGGAAGGVESMPWLMVVFCFFFVYERWEKKFRDTFPAIWYIQNILVRTISSVILIQILKGNFLREVKTDHQYYLLIEQCMRMIECLLHEAPLNPLTSMDKIKDFSWQFESYYVCNLN